MWNNLTSQSTGSIDQYQQPEDAHVTWQFPQDPLLSLKPLSMHPPDLIPSLKLTQARLDILKINCDGFLWPDEERIFIMVFKNNEDVLAYTESEQGTLRANYFFDYIIPIVEHEPWAHTQNPIPHGLMPKAVDFICSKLAKGVYEPSQGSYHSQWFSNSRRMADHDHLSIFRHSIVLQFETQVYLLSSTLLLNHSLDITYILDLTFQDTMHIYHLKSRDLTSFQVPLGLLCYTCLPQRFTNSVTEFQNYTTFILQDKIRYIVGVMIDDIGIKGPKRWYEDEEGNYEMIPTLVFDVSSGNMPMTSIEFYINSHMLEPQYHPRSHKSLDLKSLLLDKNSHMTDDFLIPLVFWKSSNGLSHITRQKFMDF